MASLIYLKECTSTNEEILQFLPSENNQLLSIYTFKQIKGRGQYGNSWESAENLNLAFTISTPVLLIKVQDHLFNFHTALLLADFLANMTNTPIRLKWPNDVIIKNKKVSGILIEKKTVEKIPFYIVGIGLNVLQKDFQELTKAGSLLTQTELKFNLNDLTVALQEFLVENLTKEISEACILKKINDRLFRRDQISVFNIKGLRQNGIIKKVDAEGFLWVELENEGLKKFFHKEIELLY